MHINTVLAIILYMFSQTVLASEGQNLQPTFNCASAKYKIERQICSDFELINWDRTMGYVYSGALKAAKSLDSGAEDPVLKLKATQRGWLKSRNECWKSLGDEKACVVSSYQNRIAFLQTKWSLVKSAQSERYACSSDLANELFVIFFETDALPAVVVNYNNERKIFVLTQSASGVRYSGSFGEYFWLKGNEGLLVWDQFKPEQRCARKDA